MKAAFGKFNRDDLLKAKQILNDLALLASDIQKARNERAEGKTTTERILGLSKRQANLTNQFYRNVPLGGFEHDFLPILDSADLVRQFDKVVENLLEFELAGKILTAAAQKQTTIDPFR